jgi:hypothetical protein
MYVTTHERRSTNPREEFEMKSVLVLEVKTIGHIVYVEVEKSARPDATKRYEQTIQYYRKVFKPRKKESAETNRRFKLSLDDYERLYEVKKEFAQFQEGIRDAVLGQLAYRELQGDGADGVGRRVEILGHPEKIGAYLVRYYRDSDVGVEADEIDCRKRSLTKTHTEDRFMRPVFTEPYDELFHAPGQHNDVRRAFDSGRRESNDAEAEDLLEQLALA